MGAALSPGCPGRRRPSSSCPRARGHPAGSAGPPWLRVWRGRGTASSVLECERGPHTRARAAALRAALLAPPPARCPGVACGRARSRPRLPPRPGGRPSRGDHQEAVHQGPLRSRRAPPRVPAPHLPATPPPHPPLLASRVSRWQGCRPPSSPPPCLWGARGSLPCPSDPGRC